MLFWGAPALGADLPALVEARGFAAAASELEALVGATKEKKLAGVLATVRLSEVAMPVRAHRGADLTVTRTGPATECRWEGDLICRFEATTTVATAEGEFVATCHSKLGVTLPVPATLVESTANRAVFEVRKMATCWELGDELLLEPAQAGDLSGVGEGTDLIPPELTGLTRDQVEETIEEKLPAFRYCQAKASGGAAGKLVVAYHIAADGTIDKAVAESSTLNNPAVQACVIARFQGLRFPPTMDGYDTGTWSITFQ